MPLGRVPDAPKQSRTATKPLVGGLGTLKCGYDIY